MAALMSFEDEDHAEKRRQNAKARAALRRVRHVLVGMDVLVSRLAIDTVHDNAGDNLCLRVEVQDICGHERVDVINAVDMAAEDFPYEIAFDEDVGQAGGGDISPGGGEAQSGTA